MAFPSLPCLFYWPLTQHLCPSFSLVTRFLLSAASVSSAYPCAEWTPPSFPPLIATACWRYCSQFSWALLYMVGTYASPLTGCQASSGHCSHFYWAPVFFPLSTALPALPRCASTSCWEQPSWPKRMLGPSRGAAAQGSREDLSKLLV